MEQLTDLKAILHSKRANIYLLEHCRVMQKDGRVLYLTEAKDENQYWNIPIATPLVSYLEQAPPSPKPPCACSHKQAY